MRFITFALHAKIYRWKTDCRALAHNFFYTTASLLHVRRKFRGHISVGNVLISRQDIFGEDEGDTLVLLMLMGCGGKNNTRASPFLRVLRACVFGLLRLQGDTVVKKFAGFV